MYRIKNIQPLNWIKPAANYLVLISPESIPHLAIVSKGRYYSLTHKKAQVGEDFKPYFDFLKRTKRKVLFIKFDADIEDVESVFQQYEKAVVGKITCLHPIKNILAPKSKADYIFDLLPELESRGIIEESFQINMEDLIDSNNRFVLNTYDKDDIYAYIETLNEKYAKRG